MDFQNILYATDRAVATITLNRPNYRNALSYRMLDEIDAAFALAEKDKAVRVVVVRGSGGTFSSGHDLGTSDALEDSLGDYQAMMYLLGREQMRVGGQRRLLTVDLAVKGKKRERYGQK
jgi:enoyl-CoA hydratase/carnithine racemase